MPTRLKSKWIACLICLTLGATNFLTGQISQTMTIDQVLSLARQQSLDAFRARNMYLSGYWEYVSYRGSKLPKLGISLTPVQYNRMMTQRYDYNENVDVYREQQNLLSYSNLYLTQNLGLTGGRIYFDSDLSRLENFNATDPNNPQRTMNLINYSATPIRIGLEQPLFGFNRYKWEKKIEPLKFEKAKQEYIMSVQELNVKGNELFFNLVLAQNKLEIAQNNLATTDTLYKIGKRRYDMVSIQQEELLDLELSHFNAEIAFSQGEKDLKKARFSLNSFLGYDETTQIDPVVPQLLKGKQVDIQNVVEFARTQNPLFIGLKQKSFEADRTLEKTTRESRFSATLKASYGLNQQARKLGDAYKDPLGQQMGMLQMDIPLIDWGERKGMRQMAQKNKEVVDIEVRQAVTDFVQEVALKAIDFNLQEKQVLSSAKADTIAMRSYELTKKRFILGQGDVLKLNTAMKARESARINYINSLYTFWKYFFELQQLTLFDLTNNKILIENFDEMIK